jgi:signal transduction histidine kinase
MINFNSFPEAVRIAFSVLTVFCVGFAGLVLILHQYRFRHNLVYWLNGAVTLIVLCQTVVNAALIAQVQHNITDGYIVPSGYIVSRYIIFAVLTAVFICLCILKKPLLPGIAVIASFLTLPVMETWAGRMFPAAFTAAAMILLVSAFGLILKIRGELQSSISSLSVKQAMDSLDTAILFYRKNGYILLMNEKMQELMLKTAGRVFFNGRLYFETVVATNAERRDFDSYLLHLTENLSENVWLFTVKETRAGKNTVIRLTATEVTEQNNINILLLKKQEELKTQQEQLKIFIKNIEEVSRSEELFRMKADAHDSIGQKLTLLLRYLHQGKMPDEEMLSSTLSDLRRELHEIKIIPDDPKTELDIIMSSFGYAGVKISVNGDLPSDIKISAVLIKVLREAAANAVIHGYADRVYVKIDADDRDITMTVTDNSIIPPKKIKPGGGITGMTSRLAELGGEIYIETSPRFKLTATVPLKESEESVING